jgi:hypothetical protein
MDEIEKSVELDPFEHCILRESRDFCRKAYSSPTQEELIELYSVREELMEKIVSPRILSNNKLVLIGHNGHISKSSMDYARVHAAQDGTETSEPSWNLLGDRIRRRSSKAVAVFFLYGHGTHSAPFCQDVVPCPVEVRPKTYEEKLILQGQSWLIRSSQELVASYGALDIVENGVNRIRGELINMCDFVIFSKRGTGL